MSTPDEVNFDAPVEKKPAKPAKKKTAKKRAAPTRKEANPSVAYPGLTRTGCADGCGPKGCVISGKSYCAHPTKGGLQTADMNDAAALKRLKAARDQLGVQVDPDRFKD